MLFAIQLLLGLATLTAALSVAARAKEAEPTVLDAERSLGAPVRRLPGECGDGPRIS
ncbi:hypothetical protein KOR34_31110 [Posidoniimonas corsicana]|uniref:Uncharacterized protein n=1 Tax=Posidoniimonas corsicana TaxID=1938618 RepID=A0A5C5VJH2_9BACT|nr:hypothetical protein [Posidoniimonas corsicana]TWT38143.1 hypothetical protein KOR34_31110 [Posidoniimonas corsicana]